MFIPLQHDYDVVNIKVGFTHHGQFQFLEGNGTVETEIKVYFKEPIEISDYKHTEILKSPCEGTLSLVSNKRRGQSLEVK